MWYFYVSLLSDGFEWWASLACPEGSSLTCSVIILLYYGMDFRMTSWELLVCGFLVLSSPGFYIRVMLASENKLQNVIFHCFMLLGPCLILLWLEIPVCRYNSLKRFKDLFYGSWSGHSALMHRPWDLEKVCLCLLFGGLFWNTSWPHQLLYCSNRRYPLTSLSLTLSPQLYIVCLCHWLFDANVLKYDSLLHWHFILLFHLLNCAISMLTNGNFLCFKAILWNSLYECMHFIAYRYIVLYFLPTYLIEVWVGFSFVYSVCVHLCTGACMCTHMCVHVCM